MATTYLEINDEGMPIDQVVQQGRPFFPITHRKAIVGLAPNTLVMSESVDVDIDLNTDGQPITINPIVQQSLTIITQNFNVFSETVNNAISNINTALLSKADSDVNRNALKALKLTTPRKIILSGTVTGSADFDGSEDITITTSELYAGSATKGGSATSALKWTTARNLALTGVVVGNVNIDGSGNASLSTTFGTGSTYLPIGGGTVTGNLGVNGRYLQNGAVGCLVAAQAAAPNASMIWAW